MASCVITGNLVTEIRVQEYFRMVDHTKFIRDGIEELQKQYVVRDEAALTETLEGAPDQVAGRLWQVTKTGVWLTV